MLYIADPGTNYNGDIEELKEIALMSKKSGATHFKPQIYNASELYKPENNQYYKLQQKCSLILEQVQEIFDYCNSINIKCMFSCFNTAHLRWLDKIGCNTLKIAASMAGNNEFVSEASDYGFDVFVSFSPQHTHFSVYEYMDMFPSVRFMSCVSKYPSEINDYNLGYIRVLQGLSDHTNNICLPIAATAIGADVIEKHVWFRYHDTPDFSSSIHIEQFHNMVNVCNEIEKIRH